MGKAVGIAMRPTAAQEPCAMAVKQCFYARLQAHPDIELASPKSVILAWAQNALPRESNAYLAMQLVHDSNLTTHTYNEA